MTTTRRNAPIKAASPTVRTLFEIAKRRGISIYDIADGLGCHAPRVSSWRRGANEPGIKAVEQFAAMLGVNIKLEEKTDGQI